VAVILGSYLIQEYEMRVLSDLVEYPALGVCRTTLKSRKNVEKTDREEKICSLRVSLVRFLSNRGSRLGWRYSYFGFQEILMAQDVPT